MSSASTDPRQFTVTLRNGLTLNLAEWFGPAGKPAPPPVLLIHGLGDAALLWRDVATALALHTSVLAVDLRGHGDSAWIAAADYRVTAMAADIGDLISTLALTGLTLVGHSMGAGVALRVAARHPEYIARLVLADFGLDADPANVAELRRALRTAHRPYPTVDHYLTVLSTRHPLASRDRLRRAAAATTRPNAAGGIELKYDPAILSHLERTAAGSAQTHAEAWHLLAGLRCPVLVLRGAASSVLAGKVANSMVQAVPAAATLRVIPMAGHSIQLDNPAAVSEAITHFLGATATVPPDNRFAG
jgi:pimeloyl-ACP methyl ester carboxylesterase